MDASVEIHPSMKQDTAVIGKTVWPQGESCCTSRLIRPTELWCVAGKYNSIISSRLRKLRGAPGHELPLPRERAPRSRAGKWCCCFHSMTFRPGGSLGRVWLSFYLSRSFPFLYLPLCGCFLLFTFISYQPTYLSDTERLRQLGDQKRWLVLEMSEIWGHFFSCFISANVLKWFWTSDIFSAASCCGIKKSFKMKQN